MCATYTNGCIELNYDQLGYLLSFTVIINHLFHRKLDVFGCFQLSHFMSFIFRFKCAVEKRMQHFRLTVQLYAF
jgi:hypothetical protein